MTAIPPYWIRPSPPNRSHPLLDCWTLSMTSDGGWCSGVGRETLPRDRELGGSRTTHLPRGSGRGGELRADARPGPRAHSTPASSSGEGWRVSGEGPATGHG